MVQHDSRLVNGVTAADLKSFPLRSECRDWCEGEPTCKGVAYSSNTQQCFVYTEDISGNIQDTTDTSYTTYEKKNKILLVSLKLIY